MKKNTLSSLIILVGLLLSFGCKARKEAVRLGSPAEKTSFSKAAVLKNISDRQLDFNTLAVKARASLSLGKGGNDVSMNIRMKRDEVIWVSVTAIAGIEVGRALITRDSIKILNRVEGVYIKKPFSYIYQFTNRQVDLRTLQSILLGNCIPGVISERSDMQVQDNRAVLRGEQGDLAYQFNFNTASKVEKMLLKDAVMGQELYADYSDFNIVTEQVMPFSVNIKSETGNKQVKAELRYGQPMINANLDFPFNVPQRFTEQN